MGYLGAHTHIYRKVKSKKVISTNMVSRSFAYIESQLRKNSFGIISTVTPQGRAHSTGIVYGVAPSNQPFSIYLITGENYKKTRNIKTNPNVSFAVPFPHHFLRFIPASCVQFQGTAEILSFDDPNGLQTFQSSRILKYTLEESRLMAETEKPIFIKIRPDEKIQCYGLGINLWQMKKDMASALYTVTVPKERR